MQQRIDLRMNIYGQYCLIFDDVQIGVETRIGNFTMIRDRTSIGRNCIIGSYVDIEGEVQIGDFVSLQSGCYITRGVIIESEVFCGPRVLNRSRKMKAPDEGPAADCTEPGTLLLMELHPAAPSSR